MPKIDLNLKSISKIDFCRKTSKVRIQTSGFGWKTLLFGGKKIPELMKGLGGGIKEFKKASKEEDEENGKLEDKK